MTQKFFLLNNYFFTYAETLEHLDEENEHLDEENENAAPLVDTTEDGVKVVDTTQPEAVVPRAEAVLQPTINIGKIIFYSLYKF